MEESKTGCAVGLVVIFGLLGGALGFAVGGLSAETNKEVYVFTALCALVGASLGYSLFIASVKTIEEMGPSTSIVFIVGGVIGAILGGMFVWRRESFFGFFSEEGLMIIVMGFLMGSTIAWSGLSIVTKYLLSRQKDEDTKKQRKGAGDGETYT